MGNKLALSEVEWVAHPPRLLLLSRHPKLESNPFVGGALADAGLKFLRDFFIGGYGIIYTGPLDFNPRVF
jgi:hypothetical protein